MQALKSSFELVLKMYSGLMHISWSETKGFHDVGNSNIAHLVLIESLMFLIRTKVEF